MFFFSSRRRHTRYWRDWSSDVCSSDLMGAVAHCVLRVGDVGLERGNDGLESVGTRSAGLRAAWLEVADGAGEVVHPDALTLHRQPERVCRGRPARWVDEGSAELAASDRDEPLGLQDPERFAQRGTTHAVLIDEIVLLRQRSCRVRTAKNPLANVRRDGLGNPRLNHAGESHLGHRYLFGPRHDELFVVYRESGPDAVGLAPPREAAARSEE